MRFCPLSDIKASPPLNTISTIVIAKTTAVSHSLSCIHKKWMQNPFSVITAQLHSGNRYHGNRANHLWRWRWRSWFRLQVLFSMNPSGSDVAFTFAPVKKRILKVHMRFFCNLRQTQIAFDVAFDATAHRRNVAIWRKRKRTCKPWRSCDWTFTGICVCVCVSGACGIPIYFRLIHICQVRRLPLVTIDSILENGNAQTLRVNGPLQVSRRDFVAGMSRCVMRLCKFSTKSSIRRDIFHK